MKSIFKFLRYYRSYFFNSIFIVAFGLCTHSPAQGKVDKKEGIKPGKRKAVLILSDGSKIELNATDSLNYTRQSVESLSQKSNSKGEKPSPNDKTQSISPQKADEQSNKKRNYKIVEDEKKNS